MALLAHISGGFAGRGRGGSISMACPAIDGLSTDHKDPREVGDPNERACLQGLDATTDAMITRVQHHFTTVAAGRAQRHLSRPAAWYLNCLLYSTSARHRVPPTAPPPSGRVNLPRPPKLTQSTRPHVCNCIQPAALHSMMYSEGGRGQQAADPFQRLSRDVIVAILGHVSFIERHAAGRRNTCLVGTSCACGRHAQ